MADIKIIVDSSDVATATNRVDQLGNSGKVAKKGIDKATRGMNQFGAVAKNGGKKMNTFNMQLQQGGYQLQDFVVQLQSGTSFFTAFGQQGSQFAGVFGPKGAVIGAVIAIGSAVGGLLVNSLMGASKEVGNLTEALAKYKSMSDKIADYNGLSKEFGNLAVEARAVLEALKAIEGINLKKQLAELGGIGKVLETTSKQIVMGGFMNLIPTFKEITHLSAKTVTDAQKFLGLTEGSVAEMAAYAGEYARALMDVQSGGTLEEQAASAGKLSEFLKEHVELRGEDTENLEQITKLQEVLLGLMKATATASTGLEAFGGEGPDLEAIAKARKKIEETIAKIRRANAVAFFRDEQEVQEAIHQVWVRNNAEQNKKRLTDIEAEKKSRIDAGKAYFKQEQDDAAAILSQRIKNILAELKAKKDADAAAMAIRRAAGEAYFGQEADAQDQILQSIIDRIMAEHEAKVKADKDALDLKRSAGEAYFEQEQDLESSIHQMRVDNIFAEFKARESEENAALAIRRAAGMAYGAEEDSLNAAIHQSNVDRIMAEHEAKVKANQDAVDLRRAAGMAYAKQEQGLENDIHQMRVNNILSEAALREATISAARAKFNAGSSQFGEASEDVLSQRIAELRKAYADSLKPGKTSTATNKKDPVAEFQKKLDLERELLGVSEARAKVLQALGLDFVNKNPEIVAGMEVQINKTLEQMELDRKRQSLIDSVNGSIEDGFMAMADGTKSVSDAFRTMAAEIVRELYKVYVMQVAIAAIKTFAGGLFAADGAVLSGGSEVKAYANGGVVGGPTTFPMAGGKTGLMGEAGPEAIMPLKRGANGKLGVQAEGGSGDIYVTNNYSISANTSEDTKRLVTQTIQQAQPALTQAAKASIMNDRRRGGQMKSVFG